MVKVMYEPCHGSTQLSGQLLDPLATILSVAMSALLTFREEAAAQVLIEDAVGHVLDQAYVQQILCLKVQVSGYC